MMPTNGVILSRIKPNVLKWCAAVNAGAGHGIAPTKKEDHADAFRITSARTRLLPIMTFTVRMEKGENNHENHVG